MGVGKSEVLTSNSLVEESGEKSPGIWKLEKLMYVKENS